MKLSKKLSSDTASSLLIPLINSLRLLLHTLDLPPPDISAPSSGEWTDSRPLTHSQRFSSPLIEVVLCVVQPQAHRHRVALPALSENVVHSGVPALRPRDWGSLGGLGESRIKRMSLALFPAEQRCLCWDRGLGAARGTVVVKDFGERGDHWARRASGVWQCREEFANLLSRCQ